MRQRTSSRTHRDPSLFSIIEKLQRKLERQGLSTDIVDQTVVYALATAARTKA